MDGDKVNLRDVYQPIRWTSEVHVGLDYLEAELFEHHQTDMAPAYQRGSVWTRDQQERFMGHLLQGGEVQPIVMQRDPDHREVEVLDGKQRLEACLAWLAGSVGARLDDGRLVRIADLVMGDRKPMGLGRVMLRFRYISLPWAERVRFYVRLNSAGTPHTQEQLDSALAAKEAA